MTNTIQALDDALAQNKELRHRLKNIISIYDEGLVGITPENEGIHCVDLIYDGGRFALDDPPPVVELPEDTTDMSKVKAQLEWQGIETATKELIQEQCEKGYICIVTDEDRGGIETAYWWDHNDEISYDTEYFGTATHFMFLEPPQQRKDILEEES